MLLVVLTVTTIRLRAANRVVAKSSVAACDVQDAGRGGARGGSRSSTPGYRMSAAGTELAETVGRGLEVKGRVSLDLPVRK